MTVIISKYNEQTNSNNLEYVLDGQNDIMKFATQEEANTYLLTTGMDQALINSTVKFEERVG